MLRARATRSTPFTCRGSAGNVGHPPVDLPCRVFAPGAQQAVELLAALLRIALRRSQHHLRPFRLRAVAGQVEVRDVARLVEPSAHVQRGGERLDDRAAQLHHLLIRLVYVERPANLGREIEHGAGDAELGLLELGGGHPLPERNVEGVQEAHDHAELEIGPDPERGNKMAASRTGFLNSPAWTRSACARPRSRVHGLEVAIVQHRDLHRVIDRQLPLQQGPHLLGCLLVQLGAAVPRDRVAERSSTAAPTSGNPALRFTDAQPRETKQQKTPCQTPSPRSRWPCRTSSFSISTIARRLHIDRETDLVAFLQVREQRGRIDPIAHRHRFHEPLDLAMLDHDLARIGNGRHDLAFTDDALRGRPFGRR